MSNILTVTGTKRLIKAKKAKVTTCHQVIDGVGYLVVQRFVNGEYTGNTNLVNADDWNYKR